MGEQRQHYNEEFKQRTVKYIQEQTKTVGEISLELNIPAGTLHKWLAKYRQFENEPLAGAQRVRELETLLREQERELKAKDRRLADLEEELAIVKKAVHIFSKPRN
ncbi:transposase [Paenibacillus thermoaerophilus]|uniref:Transposase n=1 Tax=Paenibacillus thermoaerophilus TaxID=1215385 RepID=A0ABW2V426_9BACL|nr:transposase [Paenibacillus thermoaerophilus]TMV03827.1 transposase [Paenibacillus thermoaerophilus]